MCRGGFEFSHYTCLCFLLDHTRLSSCQHAKPKIKIKPCSFPPWADETIVKLNSCSMICQIWIKHQRGGKKSPKLHIHFLIDAILLIVQVRTLETATASETSCKPCQFFCILMQANLSSVLCAHVPTYFWPYGIYNMHRCCAAVACKSP